MYHLLYPWYNVNRLIDPVKEQFIPVTNVRKTTVPSAYRHVSCPLRVCDPTCFPRPFSLYVVVYIVRQKGLILGVGTTRAVPIIIRLVTE